MTFENCNKLIRIIKSNLDVNEFALFASDIKNKLDIFLLADRITKTEYETLIGMLDD